jgi:hypothetical protein
LFEKGKRFGSREGEKGRSINMVTKLEQTQKKTKVQRETSMSVREEVTRRRKRVG